MSRYAEGVPAKGSVWRRRTVVICVTTAVLALFAATLALATPTRFGGNPLPPEMRQFAVFADGTGEALPADLSAEVTTWPGALGERSQLALEDADGKLFLIPGRDGVVCFIVTGAKGTAGSCGRTTTTSPVVVGGYRFPDGVEQAVLVAPDGFDKATYGGTSRAFAGNVVKVPVRGGAGSIEVTGPSGPIIVRP